MLKVYDEKYIVNIFYRLTLKKIIPPKNELSEKKYTKTCFLIIINI